MLFFAVTLYEKGIQDAALGYLPGMTEAIDNSSLSAMSFAQVLAFPFKTLWQGHLPVIFYVLALVPGSVAAISFLEKSLTEVAEEVLEGTSYLGIYSQFSTALYVLCVPFIIVGAGLPIRMMWHHGRFPLLPCIPETSLALQKFWRILQYSIKQPVIALVPAAVLFMARKALEKIDLPARTAALVNLLVIAALVFAAYRLLKWIFLLLLGTFVSIESITAFHYSDVVFRLRRSSLFLTALVGTSAAVVPLTLSNLRHAWYIPYLSTFIAWYTLAVLVVLTLEAAEEMVRQQGATFRPPKI